MKKSKHIFSFLTLVLLSTFCLSQPTWQWANETRSNSSETVLDIATNPLNGITYACGYFDDDLSSFFTLGLNGTPDMSAPIGSRDGLVSKYDASGNVIWAFKIGGAGATVEVEAITLAPNGNIYITGEFFDASVNFRGVASSISGNRTPTGTTKDMFLAAYNPNGELLWVTSSSDTGNSIGFGITSDVNGIYVVGRFGGDITFPPLAPITWSGTGSFFDAYITKFDYTGAAIRVKTIFNTTGDGHLKAWNVQTDGNNVYAVGTSGASSWTYGPTGFNPTDNNNGTAGTEDIWVISIRENNFNLNWASVIGSVENDIAKGIALNPLGIYLTGGLGGASVNFPGIAPVVSVGTAKDIFSAKLFSATGLTDWVMMEQNNTASGAYGTDISIDLSGNLFITGAFVGNTDFNAGASSKSSLGGRDIFVMSRAANGNFLWVETAGSNGNDKGLGVSFDNNGNVYVGGDYDLSSTFGLLNLPTGGSKNGFVAKLSSCTLSITCPTNQTVTANTACQYTLLDYTGLATPVASCGIQAVTQSPIAGTIVNSGVNPVTLYLTDLSGNVDSCSFDVIVESAVNPTVVSCGTVLTGETTVGQGDTENNFSCVGFATPGEDVYYQITVPSGNYYLQITIDNVVDANDSWLETFWIGASCPLGGGCVASDFYDIATQQFSSGGNIVQYLSVGPGTYYFVVDAQGDGIDSYDIRFECLDSGIEFDESTSCGDPDNNGIVPYVNGSTTLNVQPCEVDTFCYDMYIANLNDLEWIDSVYMSLGSCYSNVVPTNVSGFYETGNWVGTYDGVNNGIAWQFNNTNIASWGDGLGGSYSCDNGSTRKYTLCFTADINASCSADSNLNVSILITDDGIGGSGSSIAGIDVIIANGFTITNPAPTITCPTNVVANNAAGTCGTAVNGLLPVINDNCPNPYATYLLSGATTGSGINDASGTTFNVGITTIKYFVTDSAGLQDSCSFTVTVNDNEAPTFTCPSNSNEYVNATCDFSIPDYTGTISGLSDNCTPLGLIIITQSPAIGSIITTDTLITLYADDGNGNIDSCSFTVFLNDTISPVITCSSNINVNNDIGICGAVVNGIAPVVATDNCGIDSVNYVLSGVTIASGLNDASGLTFNLGITTVSYTITDLSGNTSSCSFTVSISDNEAPTFACPSNSNEYVNATCNFSIPDYTGTINGLSDNCTPLSSIIITQSPAIGTSISGHGTTQNITIYATDLNSNIDSCSFTITLLDTIQPTISCPGNQTEIVDANCALVLPSYAAVGVSDNCTASGSIVITQTPIAGAIITTDTLLTLFADDGNGNSDSCSFMVLLSDTTSPTITCPNDTVIDNDIGLCGANITLGLPVAADNCRITSLLNDFNNTGDASGAYPPGLTTVSWTATDGFSNTATCSFNVTIVDAEKPIITCLPDTTINNDNNICNAVFNFNITATDNCFYSISQIAGLPSGSTFPQGNTINTFVATDSAGLTDTCSFVVTVIDVSNPTITCPNDIVICDTNVVVGLPIVADNCMILSVVNDYNLSNDASDIYTIGITVVEWTVTDTSGNINTCSMSIEVEEKPTISDAGEDQNLVLNQNTNLEGNTPIIGSGTWSLISGNGIIDNDFDPASFLSNLIMGDNIFGWTITNGTCPPTYDEVIITVGGLEVPSGFSPNGDGNNDLFVIPGIENVASELIIFNRWGVEVYAISNYQNDWDGISNEGKTLPEDTYFYTIKLPEYAEEYSGYVVIKR